MSGSRAGCSLFKRWDLFKPELVKTKLAPPVLGANLAQQHIALKFRTRDENTLEFIRVYESEDRFLALFQLACTRGSVERKHTVRAECDVDIEEGKGKPVQFYLLCENDETLAEEAKAEVRQAAVIASMKELMPIVSGLKVATESLAYQQKQTSELLGTVEGRKQLSADVRLRDLITEEYMAEYLDIVIKSEDGIQLLADHPDLRAKIYDNCLNGEYFALRRFESRLEQFSSHEFKQPAAKQLLTTEQGKALLKNCSDLFDMLSDEYKQEVDSGSRLSI